MDEDGMKMAEVKEMVRQGEYRPDPRAVADALLQRLRAGAAARASYPLPTMPVRALTWSVRSRSVARERR
jgi:Anti-sigma-28 factor, FlgM